MYTVPDIDPNIIWQQNTDFPCRVIKDHHTAPPYYAHFVDIQFINPNLFGRYSIKNHVDFRLIKSDDHLVRDDYYPYFYGVACQGNGSTTYIDHCGYSRSRKEYDIWMRMIKRCYDTTDYQYMSYGGAGVTVCLEWRCYEYFLNTLPLVANYNLWLAEPTKYRLDKDTLQQGIPTDQKIYSPQTCMFITVRENTLEIAKRTKRSKTGYVGVRQRPSGTYACAITNKTFGTYTSPIAAASLYNKIARYRGYQEEYLNDLGDQEMDMDEIRSYRVPEHNTPKVPVKIWWFD